VILEADARDLDAVVSGPRNIMQGWTSMGTPIVADCKAGRSWGDLKEYHAAA